MTLLQSIILGIVQGITEFFPVSSSAHLRLTKWLMGIPDGDHLLYFDLICHSGTLFALIFFLHKDIFETLRNRRQIALFSLALFPLLPAYYLLKPLRIAASDPAYLGYFLMFTSFLLFWASQKSRKDPKTSEAVTKLSFPGKSMILRHVSEDRLADPPALTVDCPGGQAKKWWRKILQKGGFPVAGSIAVASSISQNSHTLTAGEIKIKDVLCIGIMQTMALIPGISRSGSTISTGRLLGWDWVAAARFSFLLAIPAILGGQALETLKLFREPASLASSVSITCYAAGFCTSFAVGMVGVRFMFKIYEKGWVRPFAWYCLLAGSLTVWALHG